MSHAPYSNDRIARDQASADIRTVIHQLMDDAMRVSTEVVSDVMLWGVGYIDRRRVPWRRVPPGQVVTLYKLNSTEVASYQVDGEGRLGPDDLLEYRLPPAEQDTIELDTLAYHDQADTDPNNQKETPTP